MMWQVYVVPYSGYSNIPDDLKKTRIPINLPTYLTHPETVLNKIESKAIPETKLECSRGFLKSLSYFYLFLRTIILIFSINNKYQ